MEYLIFHGQIGQVALMEIIKNKHDIIISSAMLNKYFKRIKNGFFKIIPIAEGKEYGTGTIIKTQKEANEEYHSYVDNFIIEICGGYYLFNENEYFLSLLTNLEGLSKIDNNELSKIKTITFHCITTCKKMMFDNEKQ